MASPPIRLTINEEDTSLVYQSVASDDVTPTTPRELPEIASFPELNNNGAVEMVENPMTQAGAPPYSGATASANHVSGNGGGPPSTNNPPPPPLASGAPAAVSPSQNHASSSQQATASNPGANDDSTPQQSKMRLPRRSVSHAESTSPKHAKGFIRRMTSSVVHTAKRHSIKRRSVTSRLDKMVADEDDYLPVVDLHRALRHMHRIDELWKLLVYLVFFGLYLYVILSLFRVEHVYSQTRALEDVFLDEEFDTSTFKKNYYDIFSFEEYFDWVKGPLLKGIFTDEYYNGNPYEPSSRFMVPGGFGGNRITSPIRFRTVRVREGGHTCQTFNNDHLPPAWVGNGLTECYGQFKQSTKNTSENWVQQFEDKFDSSVRGIAGYGTSVFQGYGDDGYYYDLPLYNDTHIFTREIATQLVEENLIQPLFADEATRVLVVEFNVVSFNLGNGIAVRFVQEIAMGGGFHGYNRMYQLLMETEGEYVTRLNVSLACFAVFLSYYFVDLFFTLRRQKRPWVYLLFSSIWTLVDFVNLVLSLVVVILIYHVQYAVFNDEFVRSITGVSRPPDQYFDAFDQSRMLSKIGYLACANVAFGWLKIFKYVRYYRRITIMWDALADAMPEVVILGLAYIIVTSAFAFTGHLLFGTWVEEFHNISASFSTVLRAILGDFNYVAIRDAEPYVAPWFYGLFIFLEFFVLLNMFIAVVSDYYDRTKEKLKEAKRGMSSRYRLIAKSSLEVRWRKVKYWMLHTFVRPDTSTKKDDSPRSQSGSTPAEEISTRHMRQMFQIAKRFQSCPSNWNVALYAPSATEDERRRWLEKHRQQQKRHIVSRSGPKMEWARKTWWWAAHESIKHRPQRKLLERRQHGEPLSKEVLRTKIILDRVYGSETYFLRNWKAINKEQDVDSRVQLFGQEVHYDDVRFKVYQILWRGVKRQAGKNKVDLFSTYDKTFKRMAAGAKDGKLFQDDLTIILGGDPKRKSAPGAPAAAAPPPGSIRRESSSYMSIPAAKETLMTCYGWVSCLWCLGEMNEAEADAKRLIKLAKVLRCSVQQSYLQRSASEENNMKIQLLMDSLARIEKSVVPGK